MGMLSAGASSGTNERVFRALWTAFAYAVLSTLATLAVRLVLSAPTLPLTPSTMPDGIMTWQLFLGIAGALAFLGLIIRVVNARAFVGILFGAALFLGVWAFAWFVLPWDIALLFASALTILQARVRRVLVHDAFVLIGTAGIAIHLAFIFSMTALAALLAAFFLYDLAQGRMGGVIADLARSTIRRGVIPGLVVPSTWMETVAGLKAAISSPTAAFLGAGDLILPLTLVVRAAFSGALQAVVVAICILVASLMMGSRESLKPAPALAWLLPGAVVPYGVMMLLKLV
jgi:hypothetical protein